MEIYLNGIIFGKIYPFDNYWLIAYASNRNIMFSRTTIE